MGSQSVQGHYSGNEYELFKANMMVMKNELRLWLLRNLMNKDLATRDIYYFVKKQGELRTTIKNPDRKTVRQAMSAKLCDVKATLKRNYKDRKVLRSVVLGELDGKGFVLRKKLKEMKRNIDKEKERIKAKYEKKIAHYVQVQSIKEENGGQRDIDPTNVPTNLSRFSSLSIFKRKEELPKPQKPLGPFVCSDEISLSRDEVAVLSRDPKFSICTDVSDFDFNVELERMLSKHRINEGITIEKNRKKKSVKTLSTDEQASDVRAIFDIDPDMKLHDNETDRLEKINKIFNENRKRKIFDPFRKTINFNERRVTDYKLNKHVNLPKPLHCDAEFQCETKRRIFMGAFKNYQKEVQNEKEKRKRNYEKKLRKKENEKKQVLSSGTERSDRKNVHCVEDEKISLKSDQTQKITNLPFNEVKAIQSLKKRIKNDEIIVSQTDKSSRFAVLTLKQYLESGNMHTEKDEKISWSKIKYLQGQVNSHVWWISSIFKRKEELPKPQKPLGPFV